MKLTKEQSELVEDHMGLAHTIAFKFINRNRQLLATKHIETDDIIQVASEELCRCAISYKKTLGSFASYIGIIKFKLTTFLNESNQVKLPRYSSWNRDRHINNRDELCSISLKGITSLNIKIDSESGIIRELQDLISDTKDSFETIDLQVFLSEVLEEGDIELIELVSSGYTNTEIAKFIHTSITTVGNRLTKLKPKLASLMQGVSA